MTLVTVLCKSKPNTDSRKDCGMTPFQAEERFPLLREIRCLELLLPCLWSQFRTEWTGWAESGQQLECRPSHRNVTTITSTLEASPLV